MAIERRNRMAIAGAAGCVLALFAAALLPGAGWRAWLAAAFLCTAAPIGAMGLLLTMRLTPGDWAEELGPFMEAGVLLLPLAALLIVPVLVETASLYAWRHEPPRTAFRAAWLSEPLFALRTVVWFAVLIGLTWLTVVRRSTRPAVACVGLVLFPTLGTMIAVDWLLSLDPGFASSGFGLYVLSIQMTTAWALALAGLVLSGRDLRRPGILGGMLLCLLLLWAYFAFTHYVISWSGNLPAGARWYQPRSAGGWGLVMWLVAATRLVPAFLLLFQTVRRSARALLASGLTVVAGTALEAAWLTLPASPLHPSAGAAELVLFAFASLAMGALLTGVYPRALAWRDRRAAS